jgi:hypothetical protein
MGKEINILLKSRKGNKRFKWQSGDDGSDPGDDYAEHVAVVLVGTLVWLGEGLKHWGGEDGESIKSLWMVNNAVYMESHALGGEGGEEEGGIGKGEEAGQRLGGRVKLDFIIPNDFSRPTTLSSSQSGSRR